MNYEKLNEKISSKILYADLDFSELAELIDEVNRYICGEVSASEDINRVISNIRKLLKENVSYNVNYACEELLRVIEEEAA